MMNIKIDAEATRKFLTSLTKGDHVVRLLAEEARMDLKVTQITPTTIICGLWEFDKVTGLEIDEELGWDAQQSGSRLIPTTPENA